MIELQRRTPFDFSLFFTAVALWVIGILLVYSATHIHESGPLAGLARDQVVWVAIGILLLLAVVSIPGVFYYTFAYFFYGLSLLLLLSVVLFTGVAAKGAERWIAIGPLRIQPSEFAKIGLLLALARYLSSKELSLERPSTFAVPLILILVPFALVLKQPDLGTAMAFCALALPVFFWAGISLLELFLLISPGISFAFSAIPLVLSYGGEQPLGVAASVPWGVFFLVVCVLLYLSRPTLLVLLYTVVGNLFTAGVAALLWNAFLKDYQKMRVISFINPQQDPFGAGYQVIQSMVAIGSGRVFGKGYLQGTQTRLSFLPEQHTDFIFSVLGEQFGLLGCVGVLLLFLYLVGRAYATTQVIKNRFTNMVIIGSSTIIAFHLLINSAMTIGMMPVTGIPLPFLSYGGSFTMTIAVLVGLILNARVSRQDF